MQLHQIRYFLAVCELLNFTKAADHCNVTQPSLTRAIQNLEQELGGLLFIRGGAGTTLTPFGESIRQELAQVQSHANSARAMAEGWMKGTKGTLRIGVSTAAGPMGIAQFLGAFQTCHKGMMLTVSEGTVDELLPRVDRSDIDAALVAYTHILPPRPAVCCLYEERLVVMVPARHRLAMLDLVPLTGLAGERILMSTHGDLRHTVLLALKAAGIDFNITCHSSRVEWLVGMVAEGAGIAIVPEGLALPPSLTTRPLSQPTQRQYIHLLFGTNASTNGLIRTMSDFADQYLSTQSNPVVARIAV